MKKSMHREGNTFVKYHGPSAENDWTKVRALAELAESVPHLRTITPLSLDEDSQNISYVWLGDLPRMITLPRTKLIESLAVLGSGLAQIHEQGTNCASLKSHRADDILPLDSFGLDEAALQEIDDRLPIALFHGDCWHGNVLVDESGDCVLIDPIQSPWLFGAKRYLLASSIVDLATLHMSLIISFRLLPLLRLNIDRQLELGEVLLDSYLGHFDAGPLRKQALRLSRAIAKRYISSYPARINFFVGKIKSNLSNRIIADVDAILAW